MTPNEEKHKEYFNKGRILVKDMTDNQIRQWQDELAVIALEARTMILAGDAELRERGSKNKEWLVSNNQPDPNVTNAINLVERSKTKINKADKLRDSMLALGMSAEDVAKLMGDVVIDGKTASRKPKDTFIQATPDRIAKPVVTQDSLLADAAESLINGINTRPVEDVVSVAVTAAHLANKQLGPADEETVTVETNNPFANLNLTK